MNSIPIKLADQLNINSQQLRKADEFYQQWVLNNYKRILSMIQYKYLNQKMKIKRVIMNCSSSGAGDSNEQNNNGDDKPNVSKE